MLVGAIKNEMEKLYYKKRIHVVLGITLFFAALMLVMDFFDKEAAKKNSDWQTSLSSQVEEINKQLTTIENKDSDEYKKALNQEKKLEFNLKENINPEVGGAAGAAISSVSGMYIKVILPMLVIIITADILSGEGSNGTLKSLLVSPIGRKNILLAKWIAATLVSIGAMLVSDLLTYLTTIPKHGLGNWNDLIVIGTENFNSIPIWEYMIQGLLFNVLTIITLTSVFILISVLFNSVAISISLSISIIIFGGILTSLQYKIDFLKYMFVLNIDLAAHLTGEFNLQHTSLFLSSMVMIVTALLTLSLSFLIFTKKDLLV